MSFEGYIEDLVDLLKLQTESLERISDDLHKIAKTLDEGEIYIVARPPI